MNPHIENVVMQFDLPDGAWTAEPYGNGHINETYLVTTGEKRFILQRVNGYVFPKPEDVMDNIERVTAFLKAQIEREGGDPARETLTLVKTPSGEMLHLRPGGRPVADVSVRRGHGFLRSAGHARAVRAFRRGVRQIPAADGGFPADSLHETIHDFHNTPARYRQLEDAIARQRGRPAGRRDGMEMSFAGSTSGRCTRCWMRWRRAKSPCASPTTTPSSTTCCWIAKPGAAYV